MEQVDGHMDLEMQLLSSPHDHATGATQMMHTAIVFIQSVQIFLASNQGSSSKDSTTYDDVESVNEDQNAPLIEPSSHSRKPIRKLMHVLHSIRAFKAHATSVATERNPEVPDQASDRLAIFEHHVTIGDTTSVNQLQLSPSKRIKSISTIVRQKDLLALEEFGGVGGAANALCTDLVNGISENEALNRAFPLCPARTHTFFHLVWEEIKRKTLLLLLVCVALSSVFEIDEEGLKHGCYDGVFVLIVLVLIVLLPSMCKYLQKQIEHRKLQLVKGKEGKVHVKRGGVTKEVYESEIVWGDLVLLKNGCEVPGDGLFVGGEPLELDYGRESYIISEQSPFLSYGERVINGDALMVVISPKTETQWSDMMTKANGDPNKRFKLENQVYKFNICIQYIQIVMGILTLLAVYVRHKIGKIDDENAYRPESMAKLPELRTFANTIKKIIKDITSLVGITEAVPFVVSRTNVYRNDKMLCGKATEEDPYDISNMAYVTRICTDTFITEDGVEIEKLIIGGELISDLTTPSPIVVEALCDGIGTLMHKPFRQVKDKFGFKSEKRWKTIAKKGAKSLEEPCGVLVKRPDENEEMVWHFNGPLKEILNMCKYYYDNEGHKAPLDDEMTQKFLKANQHKHELTTIAFAYKPTCTETQGVDDLIFIALLSLKNKTKEDTNAKVKALRERHIETVFVSSKKISVLQDIALKCEVVTNGDSESLAITGEVFRNYTHTERLERVLRIRFLGEALPSDKLLLVETMREKGQVVAYLGQRTDEAPALKRADIGIAMGTWSSGKAIENCDIIIQDECSVDLLINMVDSGKCIHTNIQRFLQVILITTISSGLISFIVAAASDDDSLTTFLLVWLCFAATFLGGMALLTKPSTDEPLCSDPISCQQSVITAEMMRNILFQVSYMSICSVIIHLKGPAMLGPNEEVKAGVSNISVFCLFFNLFNARELQKKNFFRGIHRHKEFWVAIAMFLSLHADIVMVQNILGWGTSLEWKVWVGYVLVGVASWLVDLFGKCIWWFTKIFLNRHGVCYFFF